MSYCVTIADWMQTVHQTAKDKGWWENPDRNFGELMMLATTEIAEAFEEWRNGHDLTEIYYVDGKPEGVPIELADVLIRIFDNCERYGIDLENALRIKQHYNESRPHRHGGKRA